MFKTQVLYQNIDDLNAMKQGFDMAIAKLKGIGFNLSIDYMLTARQFTGIGGLNTDVVSNGASIDYKEILAEAAKGYRVACLVYDWNNVAGQRPTNPVTYLTNESGCIPMQIPEQFYTDQTVSPSKVYPEVLCQYFIHELTHAIFFLCGMPDQVHQQYKYPTYSQKSPTEFYLFLLSSLKPIWSKFVDESIPAPQTFNLLTLGSKGPRVTQLQRDLKTLGFFNYIFGFTDTFGPVTLKALKAFQSANGLKPDGVYGPISDKTLQECLKKKPNLSKLDAWAMAIQKFEGYYPGSRSYRNNNPGNIRFVGQSSASGKDDLGFCIFPSYKVGFEALKSLLKYAATNSKLYDHNGDLYTFFAVYAPASDNNHPRQYAEFVAKEIGVPVSTPIKDLI